MERVRRALIKKSLDPIKRAAQAAYRAQFSGRNERHAERAVNETIYRNAMGGSVNLLNGKGGRGKDGIRENSMRLVRRGGKSGRTRMQQSYWGKDLAYLLRFHNQGTKTRSTRAGANRGVLPRREFFRPAGEGQLATAERISREGMVRAFNQYNKKNQ